MRRSLGLLAAMCLAMLAAVVPASPAMAVKPPHVFCKFTGTNPTIDLVVHSTGVYRSAAIDGANAWNRTSAAGSFREASGGANVAVSTFWTTEDSWAWIDAYDCYEPGTWTRTVNMNFNSRLMDSFSGAERRIVAIHELGHTYGLGHAEWMDCQGRPTVMQQGRQKFTCPGTAPWADDVAAVNDIY